MTQKEILTYALHGVNEKLRLRCCRYVAEGSTNQLYIDEVMKLIRDRADIKAKLMEEDV